MRPLAINRSTNGVTVIGFRGRNVAAASPPWHGTPDWKIGWLRPPGLPPIRTLDDIQGRARSLLGQEHNPAEGGDKN